MHLSDLKSKHVSELLDIALELDVDNASRLRKQELMFAILKKRAKAGEQIFGDGTLEILPDGFGFLRSPVSSYLASTEDIYISPSQIRRFNLHTGDTVEGEVRIPKDGERYFALVKVDKVNGLPPEALKHRILFENLTPLFPNQPLKLERNISGDENLTGRLIDILAPIGKGQRALLVASPKSGKTVLMQHIAHAITANYPDVILMVLLIDERPEEVTEMERSVKGEVIASTFDEPATRHVQVAEMVIEKAWLKARKTLSSFLTPLLVWPAPTTLSSRLPAKCSPAAWTPTPCSARNAFSVQPAIWKKAARSRSSALLW